MSKLRTLAETYKLTATSLGLAMQSALTTIPDGSEGLAEYLREKCSAFELARANMALAMEKDERIMQGALEALEQEQQSRDLNGEYQLKATALSIAALRERLEEA